MYSLAGRRWTIERMRTACLIPKATNTHSEYVLIAFLLQQWLQERAPNYVARTQPIVLMYDISKKNPPFRMLLLNVNNRQVMKKKMMMIMIIITIVLKRRK